MVRVRLKGINWRTKVLKDGRTVTYWYAWKGGPRLRGEPGGPEFVASYHEAVSSRKAASSGILLSILQRYQESSEFRDLAERTRRDYVRLIKLIEREFGDFPLAALAERGAKDVFRSWRDQLALRSRRQADYAWVVLALIIAWALDRGLVAANPCERGGRLYRGSRRDKVWTLDDELTFLERAPRHLHLALQLGLWTGQRQGDLLRLTWSAYDGSKIKLRQSKGGVRVTIPVGSPLKAALDASSKRSPVILVNTDGNPWTADGFRSSWGKACRSVGIVGVTFNDLRGTAVTRLALAGATEAEIATITGHTLRDVRSILDANYLHRDPALAEAAIRKLESRTKPPDRAPDCA
jgi:integrase